MTINFENDNDIIVYALEKIITFARTSVQIFVAQCVGWLASIIGLEPGLISYIDNFPNRTRIAEHPHMACQTFYQHEVSAAPRNLSGDQRASDALDCAKIIVRQREPSPAILGSKLAQQDTILKECEVFLHDSKQLRDLAELTVTGRTKTGRTNPLESMKKAFKRESQGKEYNKTEGKEPGTIERRKTAGKCLHCAWPTEKKGSHTVKDCVRPIKLNTSTVGFPLRTYYRQDTQSPTCSESSKTSESS
jgi:hypothetical protein